MYYFHRPPRMLGSLSTLLYARCPVRRPDTSSSLAPQRGDSNNYHGKTDVTKGGGH